MVAVRLNFYYFSLILISFSIYIYSVKSSDDIDLLNSFPKDIPNSPVETRYSEENQPDFDEDDFETDKNEDVKNTYVHQEAADIVQLPFNIPKISETLEFVEMFHKPDSFSHWIKSKQEKFQGLWGLQQQSIEAFKGDRGLKMLDESKFYAICTKLPKDAFTNNKGKHFIVSYEVQFEDTLICGGAYMKLFKQEDLKDPKDLSSFDNFTPYIIMFGPDVCGPTNKVHLIIKTLNPKTGKWIEHHLQNPPTVNSGPLTHVYGFHLKPDNTFDIYVDNKVVQSGSMLKDFQPPFTSEKMIVDPTQKKPDNWDDNIEIPDPAAKKPEEWDENQPATIPDPNAIKPADWLDDVEPTIPDENSSKPDFWDESTMGEWKAPMIHNPKCASVSGCGKWISPKIPNSLYKGKWKAPLIPNPNYKGEWKPEKIENPEYFENKHPHAIADITAIGFELWTVQKGTLFDNIVVARDVEAVKQFVTETWAQRAQVEKTYQNKQRVDTKRNMPKILEEKKNGLNEYFDQAKYFATTYPLLAAAGFFGVVIVFIFIFMAMMKSKPELETEAVSSCDTTEKKSSSNLKQNHAVDDGNSEQLKQQTTGTTTRKRVTAPKQD